MSDASNPSFPRGFTSTTAHQSSNVSSSSSIEGSQQGADARKKKSLLTMKNIQKTLREIQDVDKEMEDLEKMMNILKQKKKALFATLVEFSLSDDEPTESTTSDASHPIIMMTSDTESIVAGGDEKEPSSTHILNASHEDGARPKHALDGFDDGDDGGLGDDDNIAGQQQQQQQQQQQHNAEDAVPPSGSRFAARNKVGDPPPVFGGNNNNNNDDDDFGSHLGFAAAADNTEANDTPVFIKTSSVPVFGVGGKNLGTFFGSTAATGNNHLANDDVASQKPTFAANSAPKQTGVSHRSRRQPERPWIGRGAAKSSDGPTQYPDSILIDTNASGDVDSVLADPTIPNYSTIPIRNVRELIGLRTEDDIWRLMDWEKAHASYMKPLLHGKHNIKNNIFHGVVEEEDDWYFLKDLKAIKTRYRLPVAKHRLLFMLWGKRKFDQEPNEPNFEKHGKSYPPGYWDQGR
jgi:hypothetical protein